MIFDPPLRKGRLINRYKRFFGDIILETGEEITAHCPNSGAMLDVCDPGMFVWVSHNPDPKRKLHYTWHYTESGGQIIGINTQSPNTLVEEALREKRLAPLTDYPTWRREVTYQKHTRFDFGFNLDSPHPCYLEIKNVHWRLYIPKQIEVAGAPDASEPRGVYDIYSSLGQATADGRRNFNSFEYNYACFPDCVTTRGLKHLNELAELKSQGCRTIMLYIVQRNDCSALTFAKNIDPAYAEGAKHASSKGVEFYAYTCCLSPSRLILSQQIPVIF